MIMHDHRELQSEEDDSDEGGSAVKEAYTLRYVATTKGAVLQGVTAHLTAAHVTTGQEDDLRLREGRETHTVSHPGECKHECLSFYYTLKND